MALSTDEIISDVLAALKLKSEVEKLVATIKASPGDIGVVLAATGDFLKAAAPFASQLQADIKD